jgi:hypothetical protein
MVLLQAWKTFRSPVSTFVSRMPGLGAVAFADSMQTLKVSQPSGKFYRHIVYCVPSFSNPSGKIMSLSHRKKLVQLARKYDALIITDDVYDFLQWPTSSSSTSTTSKALLPRLVDIDRTLEPIPGPEDFGNAVSNISMWFFSIRRRT